MSSFFNNIFYLGTFRTREFPTTNWQIHINILKIKHVACFLNVLFVPIYSIYLLNFFSFGYAFGFNFMKYVDSYLPIIDFESVESRTEEYAWITFQFHYLPGVDLQINIFHFKVTEHTSVKCIIFQMWHLEF